MNNLKGIEEKAKGALGNRAIILILVKPSDSESREIVSKFNYYYYDSGEWCSIFAAGYGAGPLPVPQYVDTQLVNGVDGQQWWYSDKCFVDFKNELERRIAWRYCGEPEILVLQNSHGKHSGLDFTNYVAIDALQGVRQGYVDSISRLMESLIAASKEEVSAKKLWAKANRLSAKDIAHNALKLALDASRCPQQLKDVVNDATFYKAANRKK